MSLPTTSQRYVQQKHTACPTCRKVRYASIATCPYCPPALVAPAFVVAEAEDRPTPLVRDAEVAALAARAAAVSDVPDDVPTGEELEGSGELFEINDEL